MRNTGVALAMLPGGLCASCGDGTGPDPLPGACPETGAPADLSLEVGESVRLEGAAAWCCTVRRDGTPGRPASVLRITRYR